MRTFLPRPHRRLPVPPWSIAAVATFALLASTCLARADEGAQAEQDRHRAQPTHADPGANHSSEVDGSGAQATPLALAAPGLDLDNGTPQAEAPSLFRRWWFWSAVGAVAAATLATIVVSSRGQAPPATDLGNQEFHP